MKKSVDKCWLILYNEIIEKTKERGCLGWIETL